MLFLAFNDLLCLKIFLKCLIYFELSIVTRIQRGMFMFLQNPLFYKKVNLSLDIIKQHAMMTFGGLEE